MMYTPITENIEKIGTPEQRAKWAEALRSGKYQQVKDIMCDSDIGSSACCLHVAAIEVDGVDWSDGIEKGSPTEMSVAPFSSLAHGLIVAKFKNNDEFYRPLAGDNSIYFAELNDDRDLNFNQIADLIEGKEVNI